MIITIILIILLTACTSGNPVENKEYPADDLQKEDVSALTDSEDFQEQYQDKTITDEMHGYDESSGEYQNEDSAEKYEADNPEILTLCKGNNNGIITADEFHVFFDVPVTFTVNSSAAILPDLDGSVKDGTVFWDFSSFSDTNDTTLDITVSHNEGFWFSEQFTGSAIVMPLNAFSSYLGIYILDEGALSLIGIAGETNSDILIFKKPLTILKLPVKLYDSYDTGEIEAAGMYKGEKYPADFGVMGTVSIYYRFESIVDREGLLKTPLSEFESLRVYAENEVIVRNSLLPQPVSLERYRIYLFLSECYGLIARIKSFVNEPVKNFKTAEEYLRIGGN
jgi:hypothetical protein